MPGKFVEISPSISLRADSIQAVAVNTDRSRLTVRTDHDGVLTVVPLAGESVEAARIRILASVNHYEESCGMQLIEVDKDYWIDPADVVAVRYRAEHGDIALIFRGDMPSMFICGNDTEALAKDIVGRINAVMRERRRGLTAI